MGYPVETLILWDDFNESQKNDLVEMHADMLKADINLVKMAFFTVKPSIIFGVSFKIVSGQFQEQNIYTRVSDQFAQQMAKFLPNITNWPGLDELN